MRTSCSPTSDSAVYCIRSKPINSDLKIFSTPVSARTQQHKRKRFGTAAIAQQHGRDAVAAQQHNGSTTRTQGKKHAERQPQHRADPAALSPRFTRCTQARTGHGYARQAARVEHQIGRVDQPVDAQPFRTGKVAEQDAVKKAERLQRQVAAGQHTGSI